MAWLILLLTERDEISHIKGNYFALEGRIFNRAFVGDAGGQPLWHAAGQFPEEVQGDLGPGVLKMPDEGDPCRGVLGPEPPLKDGPEVLYETEIKINLEIDKPKSHRLDLNPGCFPANPRPGSGVAEMRQVTIKSSSVALVKKFSPS